MPLDLRIARRADDPPLEPAPTPANVVVAGNARFTLLTPALVRMEWSPRGAFEDRASFAFVHRGMPAVAHEVRRAGDGWVEIETAELVVKYREVEGEGKRITTEAQSHRGGEEGEGRFGAGNLEIVLKAPRYPSGAVCEELVGRVWRPGMRATGNLGGTTRTLDMVSGATPLEPGLLSRDGWALVDDSARPLLDPRGDLGAAGGGQHGRTRTHADAHGQGGAEGANAAGEADAERGGPTPGYAGMPWAVGRAMVDVAQGTGTGTGTGAEAGADDAETDAPNNSPGGGRAPEALDWYFFGHGRDYPRALRDFTRVAGRIPLPPRYAFGHWWSRYWAYSAAEFRDLVRQYEEHQVPLDVMVVDMDWHLDGWTGYTWNRELFPDPDGFLAWLRDHGLRTTLNLHPHDGVGKHEAAFDAMARHMGADPATAERIPFDCADPRFVEGYFRLVHHPEERRGVDFWWMDWQQGERTRIEGLDPLFWLNYLHWEDWARQPERAAERPLIFSRWGGLGNHRYQIGFSGDTYCNWESLKFQVGFTSQAGNVGYGLWSHDIGGHQPGPVEPELYVRWIQFGAFNPFLRTHTTKNPDAERRIWAFDTPYFEAAKAAIELRYSLLPYIYSEARRTFDDALPLCRPMYYAWPELDEAYRRPGQYMFGDQLLVAPVTSAMGEDATEAEVALWLPPGRWVDFWSGGNASGEVFEGPREIVVRAPLDRVPVFARAGAVLPFASSRFLIQRSDETREWPLTLRVFSGDSGIYTHYEDDGVSPAYQQAGIEETGGARTRFELRRLGADRWSLTLGATEGRYNGQRESRPVQIALVGWRGVRDVALDGTPLAPGDWSEVRDLDGYARDAWSADTAADPAMIWLRRPSIRRAYEVQFASTPPANP